jgi:transposase
MEEVLDVYQRCFADDEVLVCMDETSKQHIKETRTPLATQPGEVAKYDYEYERSGVSNLFMMSAPLEGWRHVKVTERHTKVDWAVLMRELVDEHYADKRKIVLVMDNLNTHKLSSLYLAFEPEEAHRIAQRLEIHYTPKHGSWLNMAEIEIGVMTRQCTDRRIEDQETLRSEIDAWQKQRNEEKVEVNWRFTAEDARVKLKSLYPSIQS